ncbi:MAG: carbohydrate ABC transporter permease, partial [Chloroflexi bacterium]
MTANAGRRATPSPQRDRIAKRLRASVSYVILYATTLVMLTPIVWMILSSLKSESTYARYPPVLIPDPILWENYLHAFTWIPFWRYAWNSTFLATMFSLLTVFTSAMVGFAFARLEAPGKGKLFGIVISLLMVPAIVTVIP